MSEAMKCKDWCGCGNLDPRCTGMWNFHGNDPVRDKMDWPDGGRVWIAWCSAACRDARLPPVSERRATPGTVERKSGQRYKEGFTLNRTKPCPWYRCPEHWEFTDGDGMCLEGLLLCNLDAPAQDAPVASAKQSSHKSACEPMCEAGSCADCDREFAGADYTAPSKPEAAKGPEKLACISAKCATPNAIVLKRPVGGAALWVGYCDPCWLAREQDIAKYRDCGGYEATTVLRNDKIPDRLPAPRLARDEMETWALLEDC